MIPSDLQPTLWLLQPVHRNTDSTGHQQVPLFYEGLGNDTIGLSTVSLYFKSSSSEFGLWSLRNENNAGFSE